MARETQYVKFMDISNVIEEENPLFVTETQFSGVKKETKYTYSLMFF